MVLATLAAAPFVAVGAEIESRVAVVAAPAVAPVQTEVAPSCRSVWKCNRYGCGWRNICPRRCPDRFSCYSLYGAYGPYGGVRYWGAYTGSGWGAYR